MPTHPLEPLTAAEIEQAVNLIRAIPSYNSKTRIISVMLKEPPKDLVCSWPNGEVPIREATAVLMNNAANAAYTVDLDLTRNRLGSITPAPAGAQPTLSLVSLTYDLSGPMHT